MSVMNWIYTGQDSFDHTVTEDALIWPVYWEDCWLQYSTSPVIELDGISFSPYIIAVTLKGIVLSGESLLPLHPCPSYTVSISREQGGKGKAKAGKIES